MEEMKWFSSAMLGVLTAMKLGLGLALSESLGQRNEDMACPKSAT
jgi:hypothetical protein